MPFGSTVNLVNNRAFIPIFLGGVFGACARWGLLEMLPTTGNWPWQIFILNVAGCCILGILVGCFSLETKFFHALTTGFCGAFTTFSAFSVDLAEFIRNGQLLTGFSYLLASSFVGLWGYFYSKQRLPIRMASKWR